MATYRVILEQNPSSILISDAIGPEKWVVENFDFISPGLLCIIFRLYHNLISQEHLFAAKNANVRCR